jgi:acetyl esterase/lipase
MPKLLPLLLVALCAPVHGQGTVLNDIVYKTVNQVPLRLDLYQPDGSGPHALVLWIHGGGWSSGTKDLSITRISGLLDAGIAVASLDYRLTTQGSTFGASEVIFPAQFDDVQDALLFLRQNATAYQLDPSRFGAWGTSAGGHLAALAGTRGSANDPQGDTSLQAVGDGYGPTDFFTLDADAQLAGCVNPVVHDVPSSPESRLVGFDGPGEGIGVLRDHPELPEYGLVLDASPLGFIDSSDPPLLIVHGLTDCAVATPQSHRLVDGYQALGLSVQLITHGDGHLLPLDLVDDFWEFFIDKLGGDRTPTRITIATEHFDAAVATPLDDQALPQDFDNETVVDADFPWGGFNASSTTGALPHAVALDPHTAVSSDGGALFFNAGALEEGSRAYTRLGASADISEDPMLELAISKANMTGGARLRVLLREGQSWWISSLVSTPEVSGAIATQLLPIQLDDLNWKLVVTSTGAGADMDEVDDGGETGPTVLGATGTPSFDAVDGVGIEMGPGNDVSRMLAVDELVLSTEAPGVAFCSAADDTSADCPCGNLGGTGQGCSNSSGVGAQLSATGSSSIVSGNLVLFAMGALPGKPALFFQGTQSMADDAGVPFGDGLRCVGGDIVRLRVGIPDGQGQLASDGSAGVIPDGAFDVAQQGGATAGQLLHYQLWYRDTPTASCGTGFNLSNGFRVLWRP